MKRPELRLDSGADKGRRFAVPPEGLRLGRSSSNDIPVHDAELSRNHCLFEPVGDDALRVTDLASANGTFVNDERLGTEAQDLKPGDVIRVGTTLLTVVDETSKEAGVDLGLGKPQDEPATPTPPTTERPAPLVRPLLWSVVLLALAAAAYLLLAPPPAPTAPTDAADEKASELGELRYEKVIADSKAIFRYYLALEPSGDLHVIIDDTTENRHTDKRLPLSAKARATLQEILFAPDFAELKAEYVGPDETPPRLKSHTLVYLTTDALKRVTVVNTPEPTAFQHVREKLETFAENELGIHAWHYSREELLKMARTAAETGAMKWEDRDVEYGNLAASIAAYKSAIAYLETLNPKPPEFATYRAALARATDELDTRYHNQRFAAEQAASTEDWPRARNEFRILRDMIPDTDDARNHEATLKLIDIEKRLGRKGGR